MTIDAVAQRAGSNRVLIYRVWDSKVALARDALFGDMEEFPVPDTGSTERDLREFIAQQVQRMSRPAYVKGVPGLTVELLTDPALFRDTHQRYVKPSEDGFRTILKRGQDRGEVLGDVDAVILTRVISGATTSLAQTGRLSPEQITDLLMGTLIGGLIPTRPAS